MHKTVVINVVGLTPGLLGSDTPALAEFAASGRVAAVRPPLPAVTCTAQSTYLTGALPSQHGIVGNGWYYRDECEVKFWRQSNHLVQGPKIWDAARQLDPTFKVANLFWWYNMYSSADFAVTPRPMYPADGRKIPDIYTHPAHLRASLQDLLGTFPLFQFWGPGASIESTRWIANAAIRVDQDHDPTLTLVYLPHLDYGLQRLGPHDPALVKDLQEIDAVAGELITYYRSRDARILIVSEYGIVPVQRPVYLNRHFRDEGWLAVREELGGEYLDAGASEVFAVADHQVAHVYVRRKAMVREVADYVRRLSGVADVLDADGKHTFGLDHSRSGELVAVAESDSWFTYYYWMDDARAPDFARTVDIHRKPGYDPAELFLNPADRWVKARIALGLLKKHLGFRYLLKAIPLDATLVKGSHGTITTGDDGPVLIASDPQVLTDEEIHATGVYNVIMASLTL